MKRQSLLLLTIAMGIALAPRSHGQETAKEAPRVRFLPAPLNDEWTRWIVGEWEGSGQSDSGQGKGVARIESALNGQFLICRGEAKITGMTRKKQPFVHPGILHSRAELEFVKAKVKAGQEPWKSAWEQLRAHATAQLSWTPKPIAHVLRGAYNRPDVGGSILQRDASAAYTHALQWFITDNPAHAAKAVEILNAYARTLKSIGEHDARLLVGMSGVHFLIAAELMRHTYAGWKPDDQKRFEDLVRGVLYPIIKDFYPTANGNWDAAMIQTMLAMGVFLDDRAIFNRAVDYYLKGEGNGAIQKYFNDFGECQESGRDQSHTQMGLGYLGCAAEIAWKQGVDLYGASDNRLALGFEYTAKYNLGLDVPYKPYRSVEGRYNYPAISSTGRGRFAVIYERAYHHYHDRRGMEMPFTKQVLDKTRPEGWQLNHIPWSTLMFAGLPEPPIAKPAAAK